ncbi:MAG TPA: hypothetical protein VGB55_15630, partial [Tepidisphaeraceae bacterium]
MTAVPEPGPIVLSAAKNESISLLLQCAPPAGATHLQLPRLVSGNSILDFQRMKVYQVLPVPVDVNRAGFVRHTGLPGTVGTLPRALLPMAADDGRVPLDRLRDPRAPRDPARKGVGSGETLLLWIDINIPTETPAGAYAGVVNVVNGGSTLASVPVQLQILDFVLPDTRHLTMVGNIGWDSLRKHWPDRFEVIRPSLLNRTDPKQQAAVRTLDELMTIAQSHRVQIHVPRLQPTVKFHSGRPPEIDWSDFDSIVAPWLDGSAFADRVPIGFWGLPKIDYLDNAPVAARLEYYGAAASHFDQRDWLRRAPVELAKASPGRATLPERLLLSAEANRAMSAHPRLRVRLPLELDELQLADSNNPTLVDPGNTARLECVAPGLISSSLARTWPSELQIPETWMRTDLSGLIPYAGAGGDEADVRVWAWASFLRRAKTVRWDQCLPTVTAADEPADPADLTWFYPGAWFGVDEVVPTVQLK